MANTLLTLLSPLTIKNTPFQAEVLKFCQALADEVNSLVDPKDAVYEISCEHEHSLCVLITNKNKFYRDGVTNCWRGSLVQANGIHG